jgi:hypothetical protein
LISEGTEVRNFKLGLKINKMDFTGFFFMAEVFFNFGCRDEDKLAIGRNKKKGEKV